MKKIFVLGFQPYDETMYPHLYDFLKMLEESFEVVYLGRDDRGQHLALGGAFFGSAQTCFRSPRTLASNIYSSVRNSIADSRLNSQIETIVHEGIDVAVAIDHSALNRLAPFIGDRTKMVFWSLDYISPDRDWYIHRAIRSMLKQNSRNITKCSYILVQDQNRGAVLDSIVNSHRTKKLLLPVSLRDDAFARDAAHARIGGHLQSKDRTAIMQITASSDRGSDVLIEACQALGSQVELLLQGHVSQEIMDLIATKATKPRLLGKSNDFSKMRCNISQADIGFISYLTKDLNHHFVSRSCGQMVEFIRLGIPVVVMESVELGEYVESRGCGIYIANIGELQNAIGTINANYSAYATSSRRTFEEVFNIENYRYRMLSAFSSL
jgi:hypothetical protein